MLDSKFSPQVTQHEDNGQAIGFCWKKSCATLSKSSDTAKILAAKLYDMLFFKKASILPESSAVKKQLQYERT